MAMPLLALVGVASVFQAMVVLFFLLPIDSMLAYATG